MGLEIVRSRGCRKISSTLRNENRDIALQYSAAPMASDLVRVCELEELNSYIINLPKDVSAHAVLSIANRHSGKSGKLLSEDEAKAYIFHRESTVEGYG